MAMRTVDTTTLKPLGSGGAGPWLMEDGRLLRVASGNRVIRDEGEARAMLDAYRAAAAAGTPAGHEVVAIEGGFGVAVDYVPGVGMGMHVAIGSYSPDEAGRAAGGLLRGLHGVRMGAGRDWNGVFRSWAGALAPLLPANVGGRLAELVAAVPEGDRLLHGDFHVGNVVVRGGKPAVIDMEAAGFGHPVFDLAIARSRTLGNVAAEAERLGVELQAAERAANGIWRGMLEGYLGEAGADEIDSLDRRIEILAHVERCGFAPGDEEAQQDLIARCAERLADLLPGIDRLDFRLFGRKCG